jgi:hypothetical protein
MGRLRIWRIPAVHRGQSLHELMLGLRLNLFRNVTVRISAPSQATGCEDEKSVAKAHDFFGKLFTRGESVLQNRGQFRERSLEILHSLSVHVENGVVEVVLPAKLHRLMHVDAAHLHVHHARFQSLKSRNRLKQITRISLISD